jgi:hypothetical protein
MLQVKAFEADVVECLGYKGAISAADELKGLLDGSKAAGSRKGLAAEQQALFSNLPQVRERVTRHLYAQHCVHRGACQDRVCYV